MKIIKQIKDRLLKIALGKSSVPRGLFDLSEYFRNNDPIFFDKKLEDNRIIAISNNFRYGSIITSAKNEKELDENIKDAILTSFDIPSSYRKEAKIVNQKDLRTSYAIA